MRKAVFIIFLSIIAFTLFHSNAQAFCTTFTPCPPDLSDLAHQYAYTWGLNWQIPAGQRICEAVLCLTNINDWQIESDDKLFIHLLDNIKLGVTPIVDNLYDHTVSDYFAGKGIELTTYWDDNEEWVTVTKTRPAYNYKTIIWCGKKIIIRVPPYTETYQVQELQNPPEDFRYIFNDDQINTLNLYAADGRFGFGFDPDCHYYNNGIIFKLRTCPIPEPTSLSLLGFGLLGLIGLRKKK